MANSVYIHIPFCEKKCYYCDFNSIAVNGQPVEEYLAALDKEVELTTQAFPPETIKTIFIGGGTPSILEPKQLEKLFITIHKYFTNFSNEIEFTIELNPGTLTSEKLKVMKDYGINRLSMGVQAFQDELLTYIGRVHTERDVYESINQAKRIGFNNINIDLMFGLPKQTIEMLMESLEKALSLDIQHYSIYSLKVEEKTLFYKWYENNKLPLPTEEDELEMYKLTIAEMEKKGFQQYEISNFAKKGFESKHNITYWKNKDYYGLGAGAHGYINNIRYENHKGLTPYIDSLFNNKLPLADKYSVSEKNKMEDMMMLGLRMLEGVNFKDFKNEFNLELGQVFSKEIEKLINMGLIVLDTEGVRLSKKGLIYGNEVFAEFISL